jgi:hypothetical protein
LTIYQELIQISSLETLQTNKVSLVLRLQLQLWKQEYY